MPETRTHTDLGEESLGVDGRGHLVAQDFHRDAPPQRTLFSEIHVSGHAALQRSFEPVPEAQGVSNTGKMITHTSPHPVTLHERGSPSEIRTSDADVPCWRSVIGRHGDRAGTTIRSTGSRRTRFAVSRAVLRGARRALRPDVHTRT